MALENAPVNLDPRIGTDQASGKVFQLILNGLVTTDPDGNIIPDLAESWEVLEDGGRYRFHLRPQVVFHDGRPMTSRDVAWTFGTIIDGSVTTAKGAAFAVIDRIETPDPATVELVLHHPFGALLVDLTPAQGIIPFGTTPEEMNRSPIGTGPFRFLGRTPETVTLSANPDYWGEPPSLQKVVFKEVPDSTVRALELLNGSVQLVVNDLAPDVVSLFRKNQYFQVVEKPGANYAYLGLNLEDPLLSDLRVRRALAMSIDRQRLVSTLWQGLGVVTETMLPPGLWARHNDLEEIPYDPQAAARLLEEAGYPDPDGDGPLPRISLTYKCSTSEAYVLQAQVIQDMAKAAGIHLEIRSYEFATFYADVRKGNFQMFSSIRTGIIEPNIYRLVLHSTATPPGGQNRGRYNNPEFDRLIDQGARFSTPEDRYPYYRRAQEIFAEDLPYLSLFTRINYAVMPQPLEGYVSYPSGELYSLAQVRWVR
ncbi:MAG: ABC transporter substrate-binding protein [Deltaproteobacteria bacterium]|nr:ABC transporter substrate-binding protein [Deltaproteobacteria bacterium]